MLMTKKTTTYVLEGKLNFSLASEGGLPTFIIVAFKVRNSRIEDQPCYEINFLRTQMLTLPGDHTKLSI